MENGQSETVNGLILVDKPAGWTSHDVVAKVRNLLKQQMLSASRHNPEVINNVLPPPPARQAAKIKVGHSGTLDPFATGLLVLVVGSYTKKAQEFSGMDKTYEAEMVLGATSDTGDLTGHITPSGEWGVGSGDTLATRNLPLQPTQEQLEAVLEGFVGVQMQIPHKYSAKKINGQKAYDLAREGKEVNLEPKQVTVYRLQVAEYSYPSVKFTASVSSGTYIRVLAEDIGRKLGTGAYLSALRRTSVGKYKVEDAQQIDKIATNDIILV